MIKFRDEEPQKNVIPKTKLVQAHPSAFVNPQHSYIITGTLEVIFMFTFEVDLKNEFFFHVQVV